LLCFNLDLEEPFGFGSFRIAGIKKSFKDGKAIGQRLYSPYIEIIGIKWRVMIESTKNDYIGIYLYREG